MRKSGLKLYFISAVALFGLLIAACDNDSSSTSGDSAARINLLFAGNGTLTPSGQPNEYYLYLVNVSDKLLWYTDRTLRESGEESLTRFFGDAWEKAYGQIPPNALLDASLSSGEYNDGMFLILEDPEYESGADTLSFRVTLLSSTLDLDTVEVRSLRNAKLTILDNNKDDQTQTWSFAQVAGQAFFEYDQTEDSYKLHLETVHPNSFYLGDAPNRFSLEYPTSLFVSAWRTRFGDTPPNASLTSYTPDGALAAQILTLDDPVYDEDSGRITYTAKLLHGEINTEITHYSATLFVDSAQATNPCGTGFTQRLTIINRSSESVWVIETPPGGLGSAAAAQWDWWKNNYGETLEMTSGEIKHFCVPDKGAPGGNIHFAMGCDANGDNCIIGPAAGDLTAVNTLFEPTFGCSLSSGCAFNPAADPTKHPKCASDPSLENCGPIPNSDNYDLSAVDGFTIPLGLRVTGSSGASCTSIDMKMVDLASCPSENAETLWASASSSDALQEAINGGINLLTTDTAGNRQACASPCKWFTTSTLGDPPCPSPNAPDTGVASYYCCQGSGPGAGGSQCVVGPKGDNAYPIAMTNYVTRLKAMGYKGYTWQYDDADGDRSCNDSSALFVLVICPNGGAPYRADQKWAYNKTTQQCVASTAGTYGSLFDCQKANMMYSCVTEMIDGSTPFSYCAVDASGTMSYADCQSACQKWEYDQTDDDCIPSADGAYSSYADCRNANPN